MKNFVNILVFLAFIFSAGQIWAQEESNKLSYEDYMQKRQEYTNSREEFGRQRSSNNAENTNQARIDEANSANEEMEKKLNEYKEFVKAIQGFENTIDKFGDYVVSGSKTSDEETENSIANDNEQDALGSHVTTTERRTFKAESEEDMTAELVLENGIPKKVIIGEEEVDLYSAGGNSYTGITSDSLTIEVEVNSNYLINFKITDLENSTEIKFTEVTTAGSEVPAETTTEVSAETTTEVSAETTTEEEDGYNWALNYSELDKISSEEPYNVSSTQIGGGLYQELEDITDSEELKALTEFVSKKTALDLTIKKAEKESEMLGEETFIILKDQKDGKYYVYATFKKTVSIPNERSNSESEDRINTGMVNFYLKKVLNISGSHTTNFLTLPVLYKDYAEDTKTSSYFISLDKLSIDNKTVKNRLDEIFNVTTTE
jgi:hypothetical protein